MNKNLGKGKYYSIAKAALIYYYEENKDFHFLDVGQFGIMHRIVDIAGAYHCGPDTAKQVSSRLSNSSLWESDFVPGFYKGIVPFGGGVNTYKPSEKGEKYYQEKLKNR